MPTRAIPCRALVTLLAVSAAACSGSGVGLDANGQPLTSASSSSSSSSSGSSSGSSSTGGGLTADFDSIQENVFTPICAPCHSGGEAPEGLALDAGHAYGNLVGVYSTEQPTVLRVAKGNPDQSYLIQKLEGAPTISGMRMPYGGPYLPQSTIDVIAQWITDGAQPGAAEAAVRRTGPFALTTTSPPDGAVLSAPVASIAVAFNHEVDASLVNASTIELAPWPAAAAHDPITYSLTLAQGNPAAVLILPRQALAAGTYQVTIRASGAMTPLADLDARTLGADQTFVFTVEPAR